MKSLKAVLTPLFAALIFLSSAENACAEDGVWKAVDYNGKARWTAAFTVQGGKVVSGKLSTICDPNICNNQTYSQECSVGGFAEDKPLTDTFIGCSGWRDLRGNLFDTMQSDGESKNAGAANLKFLTGRDLEMFEAETQKPENQGSMNVDGANVSFSKLTTREYAPRIAEILAAEEAEKQRLAAAAEKQRLAQEAAERERLVAEQAERERLAAEKVEQERLAAAAAKKKRQAAARAKKKRLAAAAAKKKKPAAAKAEKAKLAAAKENAEKERLAKAKKQKMAAAKLKAEAKKKKQSAEIGIKTADQAKQFSADLQSFVQKHPDKIDALKLAEFFTPAQQEIAAGSFAAKGSNFGKLTAVMSENKDFKAYRSTALKARTAKQAAQKKLALGKISDGVKTMKTTIAKNPLAANAFGLIKLVKQYETVRDKDSLASLENAVASMGDEMTKLGVKPPFAYTPLKVAVPNPAKAQPPAPAPTPATVPAKASASAPAPTPKRAPASEKASVSSAPKVQAACLRIPSIAKKPVKLSAKQQKLKRAAEQGDTEAQYLLGSLFYRGQQGVPKDYVAAAEWLGLAAAKGDASAKHKLRRAKKEIARQIRALPPTTVIDTTGKEKLSIRMSVPKLQVYCAAEKGDANAQFRIGKTFWDGQLTGRMNSANAIPWLQRAIAQNHGEAKTLLAELNSKLAYMKSIMAAAQRKEEAIKQAKKTAERKAQMQALDTALRRKDWKTALPILQPFAEQGYPRYERILGDFHLRGRAMPKDAKAAAKWYKLAANHGDMHGQVLLSMLYYEGTGVAKDLKAALKWSVLAAKQGNGRSAHKVAAMYQQGHGTAVDKKEAVAWLTKAVEYEFEAAYYDLAEMYKKGEGTPRDYKKAWSLLLRARNKFQHSGRGAFEMGRMQEQGQGLLKNPSAAMDWYKEAAKKGYKPAAKKFAALKKSKAEHDAKPEVQLKNGYSRYMFIQGCYDIRKSYLVKYLSDEQMAAAKVSIKEFENHYKSKYKNIDTGAAWEQATAAFEKEFGNTFRTLSSIPDYNKQTKAGCQLEHMALTSFRAPGAKAKKKKKDF